MYVRTWNKKGQLYAGLVKSKRVNGKVTQDVILYFGPVTEDQVPYLKAAYSKDKPELHYQDGRVYVPEHTAS